MNRSVGPLLRNISAPQLLVLAEDAATKNVTMEDKGRDPPPLLLPCLLPPTHPRREGGSCSECNIFSCQLKIYSLGCRIDYNQLAALDDFNQSDLLICYSFFYVWHFISFFTSKQMNWIFVFHFFFLHSTGVARLMQNVAFQVELVDWSSRNWFGCNRCVGFVTGLMNFMLNSVNECLNLPI